MIPRQPSSTPLLPTLKAWEQVALRHYAGTNNRLRNAHLAEWFILALQLQRAHGTVTPDAFSSLTSAGKRLDPTPLLLTAEIENRLYALFAE